MYLWNHYEECGFPETGFSNAWRFGGVLEATRKPSAWFRHWLSNSEVGSWRALILEILAGALSSLASVHLLQASRQWVQLLLKALNIVNPQHHAASSPFALIIPPRLQKAQILHDIAITLKNWNYVNYFYVHILIIRKITDIFPTSRWYKSKIPKMIYFTPFDFFCYICVCGG